MSQSDPSFDITDWGCFSILCRVVITDFFLTCYVNSLNPTINFLNEDARERSIRSESSQLDQAELQSLKGAELLHMHFLFLNTQKLCHNSARISTMAVKYMKLMEKLHCGVCCTCSNFIPEAGTSFVKFPNFEFAWFLDYVTYVHYACLPKSPQPQMLPLKPSREQNNFPLIDK